MTAEFERALGRLCADIELDDGFGADMVAVGVKREDCLELLASLMEGESLPLSVEVLAAMIQMAVVVGVWVERERWQPSEAVT